ncbi:MAG: hypothetical protein U0R71_09400 [Solirubrobacterales bacterium]
MNQRRRTAITWLALAALAAALALPAGAGAEFAQPGVIEGKVTVAPSGKPVAGIEICASGNWAGEWVNQCALSKEDGSYEVIGLPPEVLYRVQFSSGESGQKLTTEYWRNVTKPAAATLIAVNEAETVTGINAQLQPAGVGATPPRHGHHEKHKHHRHEKHHHRHHR